MSNESLSQLEEFAKTLITSIRDQVIRDCDLLFTGRMSSPSGIRWRESLKSLEMEQAARLIMPDVVDITLFQLLDMIDNDILRLAWQNEAGDWLPLEELGFGEMAGWLAGNDGWRKRFSMERWNEF